jgi:hypothetical protein
VHHPRRDHLAVLEILGRDHSVGAVAPTTACHQALDLACVMVTWIVCVVVRANDTCQEAMLPVGVLIISLCVPSQSA